MMNTHHTVPHLQVGEGTEDFCGQLYAVHPPKHMGAELFSSGGAKKMLQVRSPRESKTGNAIVRDDASASFPKGDESHSRIKSMKPLEPDPRDYCCRTKPAGSAFLTPRPVGILSYYASTYQVDSSQGNTPKVDHRVW